MPARSLWRRTSLAGAAAIMSAMSVMPAISPAGAAPARGSNCPAAESLVPVTTWHNHALTPGVTLSEGTHEDSRGVVSMHVLRATTTTKGLSFAPLMRSLAERTPLSILAAGKPHLVAAVNTGFFDFFSGAPLDPVVVGKVPVLISSQPQEVVGTTSAGNWQGGSVWLKAELYAGTKSHSLVDVNEDDPGAGIGVYTSAWGSWRLPSRFNTLARPVVANKVGAAVSTRHGYGGAGATVPKGGYMLVAKGSKAESWLSGLKSGTKVGIAAALRTNAPRPFVQAYGVGVQLVQRSGVALTGFGCDSANTRQPARTAIGFTDGGKKLVIAEVEDHPGTSLHGLDNDQMSKLMEQLGVSQAFDFDGSGSTEMLARLAGSSKLVRRTYPADGVERPMPLGLGIFSKKVG